MKKQPPSACEHCGGLVYPETKRCPQCGRFPVKLHLCPRCHMIASASEDRCPRCGRLFEPEGDYL
jgi:RNA polymerase subunit RPABC4/transcription elongation factor Spt4